MKRIARIALVAALASWRVEATVYTFTTDIPVSLPGVGLVQPWMIVSHDTAAADYALQLSLPPRTPVGALHRMNGGDWLLSLTAPFVLGGSLWVPGDIVRYNPGSGTYSCFFRASAAGLPPASGIDALYLSSGDSGPIVLSFNNPTAIGTSIYDRADLVSYVPTGTPCTGWAFGSLLFDASAHDIPVNVDLTAADTMSGSFILSFDVPFAPQGTLFFPGDLVSFNPGSGSYALMYRDPAWPKNALLNDVGVAGGSGGGAGTVPDGRAGTTPLRVAYSKASGNLTLTWGASCSAGDADYEVYEGALVRPWVYGHTSKFCSTGGATSVTFPAPSGGTYYLVVSTNGVVEGSYGKAVPSGAERPQGTAACRPRVVPAACP